MQGRDVTGTEKPDTAKQAHKHASGLSISLPHFLRKSFVSCTERLQWRCLTALSSQQLWASASWQHPKDPALNAALFTVHAGAMPKAPCAHRPRHVTRVGCSPPRHCPGPRRCRQPQGQQRALGLQAAGPPRVFLAPAVGGHAER